MGFSSLFRFLYRPILALPCALLLIAVASHADGVRQITLDIGDIRSPAFSAQGISAALEGRDFSRLTLHIDRLTALGRDWQNLKLVCGDVRLEPGRVECRQGMLHAPKPMALSFAYAPATKHLELALAPGKGENWHLDAHFGSRAWRVNLDVVNGRIAQLAAWLPPALPQPTAGSVTGTVHAQGMSRGEIRVQGDLTVAALAFSDASGLHAGDKLGGKVRVQAEGAGSRWRWSLNGDWQTGELFWQPIYFAKGGQRLIVQGRWDRGRVDVDEGVLTVAGVGRADFQGSWDYAGRTLRNAYLKAADVDLTGLYGTLLKPFLEKSILADLRVSGRGDLAWRYQDGRTRSFNLRLQNADFEDGRGRFALMGAEVDLPWAADHPTQGTISLRGGQLWHVPLGSTTVPLRMNGWDFQVADAAIPLLNGRFTVENFQAAERGGAWAWQFAGGLTPVSMDEFSRALGLPAMHGTLSGVIPEVSYRNRRLSVSGALLFKVFDGTVVVKNLAIDDPLGRAPRLQADADMRDLDLGLLTRTFSFGNMEGRIDADINGLVLSNWQPVQFEARLASSPGRYRKRISQRAVENISALGGAGAAAAIQRSFLRFFDEFSYDRIGLSCVLRNGVCTMDGIGEAGGGYVIVKGGGIPAITVIGYNRNVSWDELLTRLKRITQGNARPVVK